MFWVSLALPHVLRVRVVRGACVRAGKRTKSAWPPLRLCGRERPLWQALLAAKPRHELQCVKAR